MTDEAAIGNNDTILGCKTLVNQYTAVTRNT